MTDNKIIFSMVGVGKVHKPNKQVLKDIEALPEIVIRIGREVDAEVRQKKLAVK